MYQYSRYVWSFFAVTIIAHASKNSANSAKEMSFKEVPAKEMPTVFLYMLNHDKVVTKLATILSASIFLFFDEKMD